MSASVGIVIVFVLGCMQVTGAAEQLSLTDFLLDFLLSLWVPFNYVPSPQLQSIPDPTQREQLISIEKSKVALNNFINHLLRYSEENGGLINGQVSDNFPNTVFNTPGGPGGPGQENLGPNNPNNPYPYPYPPDGTIGGSFPPTGPLGNYVNPNGPLGSYLPPYGHGGEFANWYYTTHSSYYPPGGSPTNLPLNGSPPDYLLPSGPSSNLSPNSPFPDFSPGSSPNYLHPGNAPANYYPPSGPSPGFLMPGYPSPGYPSPGYPSPGYPSPGSPSINDPSNYPPSPNGFPNVNDPSNYIPPNCKPTSYNCDSNSPHPNQYPHSNYPGLNEPSSNYYPLLSEPTAQLNCNPLDPAMQLNPNLCNDILNTYHNHPSPPNYLPLSYPSPSVSQSHPVSPNYGPQSYPASPSYVPQSYPVLPNYVPQSYPAPPNYVSQSYPAPLNYGSQGYPALPNYVQQAYNSPHNFGQLAYSAPSSSIQPSHPLLPIYIQPSYSPQTLPSTAPEFSSPPLTPSPSPQPQFTSSQESDTKRLLGYRGPGRRGLRFKGFQRKRSLNDWYRQQLDSLTKRILYLAVQKEQPPLTRMSEFLNDNDESQIDTKTVSVRDLQGSEDTVKVESTTKETPRQAIESRILEEWKFASPNKNASVIS